MNYNDADNKEMWDWQDEDYSLQTNASNSLWNNVTENQDDLSCVFNETTPAKALEDLDYQVNYNDNINKETEPCKEAFSQAKRRRMLHFDNEISDMDVMPFCEEDYSSVYLKSKEWDTSMDEALSDMNQWVAGFADDTSGNEGLDLSSEEWLADCLISDTEMHLNIDDSNPSADVQIDLTESNDFERENGCGASQTLLTPTRKNITLKGKRSFIKKPTKTTSSVVLPFDFVKPCGMQGAVTIKDINQKILTPPPSKLKYNKENATKSYPTSAFSGKPVVGQTKIRTEGGKGSITIMRTKG
ncbi:protein XRI1-like isoform X2 [Bidens hawaiensis]|uniref:protein XRI1-like isoform X2 n=1 Tax=Bidens hawaiensis TaxID=980011 RepID=UPI00404901D7